MKYVLNEAVAKIANVIVERFGTPLIGLNTLNEIEKTVCQKCGIMPESFDEDSCSNCGMMPEVLSTDDSANNNTKNPTLIKNPRSQDITKHSDDAELVSDPEKQNVTTTAQKSSKPGLKKLNEKTPF